MYMCNFVGMSEASAISLHVFTMPTLYHVDHITKTINALNLHLT